MACRPHLMLRLRQRASIILGRVRFYICVYAPQQLVRRGPETLEFYRKRAFEDGLRIGTMLWRAFDKTV
jgi:hypothetical protein